MDTGLLRTHYVQTFGFFGVRGDAFLAKALGSTPVDVSNIIMQFYSPSALGTGLMNTSFVFDYYGMYGLASIAMSLPLLWALDLVLLLYRPIKNDGLLLCGLAVGTLTTWHFVSARFTSGLLSGGFVIAPLTVLLLDFFVSRPKRRHHWYDYRVDYEKSGRRPEEGLIS
jgi:hypothetical protein